MADSTFQTRPPHRTSTTAEGNLSPVECREASAARPDWIRGALAVLALAAALAAVERNDQYTQSEAARHQAEQAAARAQLALAKANDSPAVRLDLSTPDAIRCDQFHIRKEWSQAIGERCIALGQLILSARSKE